MTCPPPMIAAAVLATAMSCRAPDGGNVVQARPPSDAAAPGGASTGIQQEVAVTRVVESSTSAILSATHILVVTVLAVDEADQLRIDLALADVLKGEPIAAAGTRLSVSAQRSQSSRRELEPAGPWALAGPTAGVRLVVFSRASSSAPAAVLAEPAILRVLPAIPAEEEVRRAIALEAAGGALAPRITAVGEPPPLSSLFGEYVVARLGEETLYGDPVGFDTVMTWLEDPRRSPSLQMFMLQALTGKLLLTEPNPAGFTERMALAALRILASTGDEALAGQIVDVYLPNLLGLEGSATRRTAVTIVGSDDRTRSAARAALQRRAPGGARDRLLDWLGR